MKRLLHKAALSAERVFDTFHRRQSADRVIDAYTGYAMPDHVVIRGRVLTAHRRQIGDETTRKLANFRQMLSLFLTDEVANVKVKAADVTAITDDEGYFTLLLPRPAAEGWIDVELRVDGTQATATCPAFVPTKNADFMVVSDIDDTLMETGAYSLMRNLWTSMTGNTTTRHVYPDAVQLVGDLSASQKNPVFYVSSSPWNLYGFLTAVFERQGLPRAPMFLRDLGLSETKFITDGHGNHKGGAIDMLIRAHPDLRVILLGDTGQHDAVIYAKAAKTHPGRVAAVVLRETADGSDAHDLAPIRQMESAGVAVFHGPNFPTASDLLTATGSLTRRND